MIAKLKKTNKMVFIGVLGVLIISLIVFFYFLYINKGIEKDSSGENTNFLEKKKDTNIPQKKEITKEEIDLQSDKVVDKKEQKKVNEPLPTVDTVQKHSTDSTVPPDNNNVNASAESTPIPSLTPPPAPIPTEVPLWSWQIVDFKTLQECQQKGNEFMGQGYGYACDDVLSQNGVYMGQMLTVFEPNTGNTVNWR